MNQSYVITVIGAGYVGLTTSVLLANSGHKVYLIESNEDRLESIKNGVPHFYELGIEKLLKNALATGSLKPTDSYETSVRESEVVFSCVGTPDLHDGSSDLSQIFAAANNVILHMQNNTIYVQKSTVPVGTGEKVKDIFKAHGKHITYLSNPEFLREGTAIIDSLSPERVVIGGEEEDSSAIEYIFQLYRQMLSRRKEIAANILPVENVETLYIATSLNSAELIKVTSNAFLALKISFANSIARLAVNLVK